MDRFARFPYSTRRAGTNLRDCLDGHRRNRETDTIIINLKTIVITVLAVVSTYVCRRFEITADFPMTLIGTAVVFPIVFSISGAYKRRENALARYGSIKAHGRAIYFAARDWLEPTDSDVQARVASLLGELLVACRRLFSQPISEMADSEKAV